MKNIIDYIQANSTHLDDFNLNASNRRTLENRISMIMADMLFDIRDELDKSWIRSNTFWMINGVLQQQVNRMESEIYRMKIENEALKSIVS